MKGKIIFFIFISTLWVALPAGAQPKARAARQAEQNEPALSVRAQISYPRSRSLPEDVIWMREIYRTLDLEKEPNGALYYPVEPMGERTNLFTLIFKLLSEKKIPAYEYLLDGSEQLAPEYKMNFRDILDRYQIYYEYKAQGRDTTYIVHSADVPSADVLSYFVKEVWYFDQRTSTYGSVITALCPVMHRAEEFSYDKLKLPMFWIDYKDLAPYLAKTKVMTSNLNNVANRNIDDFFASRLYKGDIYRTTNMTNQSLPQSSDNDSILVKAQKQIEMELSLFEKQLYGKDVINKNDSTTVDTSEKPDRTKRARERNDASEKAKKASSSDSSTIKATVRRQRR